MCFRETSAVPQLNGWQWGVGREEDWGWCIALRVVDDEMNFVKTEHSVATNLGFRFRVSGNWELL